MAEISLLKTGNYDLKMVQNAVARHFDLLEVNTITPDMHVVLKPNLIMRAKPNLAATTHPVVVEAVARHLQSMGVKKITIADSPGGLYTPGLLSAAYEASGYTQVAAKCGIELNTDVGASIVRRDENLLCREFDIINPLTNSDFVISLCKLKTHCMMTMSAGVKNMFGSVPGLLKPELHYRFPEEEKFARMLVDLWLTVRPQMTIVDGIICMEGDGPTAGTPIELGVTAAAMGENVFALDLVLSEMIGLKPQQVATIKESIARDLCPRDRHDVFIYGDAEEAEKIRKFEVPASKSLDFTGNVATPISTLLKILRPMLESRPKIRLKDCIGCAKCAQSCPAHTIKITSNHKAEIDYSNCIRCYCCHELCPSKAIDIKSSRLLRIFSR